METMQTSVETASSYIAKVKRHSKRRYLAEEKIRIVLEGMKREVSVADLCRKEGIHPTVFYNWNQAFMEAGKARLKGDSKRQATDGEVEGLKKENSNLKELLAETTLEKSLLKKSLIGSEPIGISR